MAAVQLTPEQLRQLREELPPFADAANTSLLQQAFCGYYGIDFAARMPGVDYRVGTLPCGDFTLAVHRWQQPGATSNLFLVHGYFDHSGLYGKLIEYGLSRNCNVLIFDLPGHGLSSGEPAAIDDFADYGRAIAAVLAGAQLPALPLWVMAQSTGCAALVEYARQIFLQHNTWPFAATVLLAPLVRPRRWQLVRVAHVLLGRFADSTGRKFAKNSSDEAFLQFLKNDPLQSRRVSTRWVGALRRWLKDLPAQDLGVGPALVVQGDADRTVDWQHNLVFISRLFPGSQIEIIPEAGHQLANESAPLRRGWQERVTGYLKGRGVLLAEPRITAVATPEPATAATVADSIVSPAADET